MIPPLASHEDHEAMRRCLSPHTFEAYALAERLGSCFARPLSPSGNSLHRRVYHAYCRANARFWRRRMAYLTGKYAG